MEGGYQVRLFGGLQIVLGEQTHTRFRTRKAASLLAFLALYRDQAHTRECLLELFWPDRAETEARNNLSTALSQLRSQVEPAGTPAGTVLLADRQTVRLQPALTTDAATFEKLFQAASRVPQETDRRECLEEAVALYRGELLPGCDEPWAVEAQRRFQTMYGQALRQLRPLQEQAGDWEESLQTARLLVQQEPYAEDGYQAHLRLLALLNRSSEALEVYERLVKLYGRELSIAPSAETRMLAAHLRSSPHSVSLSAKKDPAKPASASNGPAADPEKPPSLSAPSLPLQLTRFFGREAERNQLQSLLTQSDIRLVTLLGPGGAGKTRLSVEVGQWVAPNFANRVWFQGLAELPDASLLLSALTHTLKLPADPQTDPLDRIVAFLSGSPCLLILDNFEHLLKEPGQSDKRLPGGAATLVRLLLERLPDLTCLVTSRQPLRLGGEQEFSLPSLSVPLESVPETLESLLANDSIALYNDRARAVRPDFTLNPQNASAVAALCRKLEGMPLALEMAAAWIKTLSPAKMLERLDQQLDMLISRRRDLPPRHQSLRAAIEWSFDLLSPDLQEVFARLSVFRGGWTLEAAEAVCGYDALEALHSLQEQSLILVQETPEGEARYRMLEPLREFAHEKLHLSDDTHQTLHRHAAYFYGLLKKAHARFMGPEQKEWFARLEADQDNIRTLLRFCLEGEGDLTLGLEAVGKLWWYWHHRSYQTEARQWIQCALPLSENASAEIRFELWNGAANLAHEQGEAECYLLMQKATAFAEETGNRKTVVSARNNLAIMAYDSGEIALAQQAWEENVQMLRGSEEYIALGVNLANLGELEYDAGHYERARTLLEESLQVRLKAGAPIHLGRNYLLLTKVVWRQGDLVQAEAFLHSGLTILAGIPHPGYLVEALEVMAGIRIAQGQPEPAACLLACTDACRQRLSRPRPPNELREYEQYCQALQETLTASELAACRQEGSQMTLEQGVDYVALGAPNYP